MHVLVTGASGFLGTAVAMALSATGHSVTALSRTRTELPHCDHTVTGDLLDPKSLDSAVAHIDAVCHLAALTRVRDSIADPIGYWRTNTCGTINLLEALARHSSAENPKRIVLASTGAVYGETDQQPITEDAPSNPGNPYAASKLAADQAAAGVAATGSIGAVSLRAFNAAGGFGKHYDHDATRLIPKILEVQAGRADELVINGDGSAVRDFVHVLDMADAFVRSLDACEAGNWRPYNVGSGRKNSIRDVLEVAERVTGRSVPVRHRPPAPEPPVMLADPSRIQEELAWHADRSDLFRIISDGWTAVTSGYSSAE